MIPYGKQNIDKKDIEAVLNVLKSDYLTQGPTTPLFEKKLIEYTGSRYSVAVVNATCALHISCLSLGLKEGDFLWTSPISFVASANCARYCGAHVDFVDIDPITYNMCTDALEKKLIEAEKEGKLPKIVIPVHLAGQSCDMKKIKTLSVKYGFKIIEDASHAVGGSYQNNKVGSCEFSDIVVFSFHPVKIITTCEGGACMTNDEEIYRKLYRLRSHGIVRDQSEMVNLKHGEWYYEQIDLGFNYRLNDLQAALGINQLNKIDTFIEQRNEVVKKYNTLFKGHNFVKTPTFDSKSKSSHHLYIIRILEKNHINRKNIFNKLRNDGYFVNVHYIPIYKHPYYQNIIDKEYPNAEKYYEEAISLPIYPGLQNETIEGVIKTINSPINFQNLF